MKSLSKYFLSALFLVCTLGFNSSAFTVLTSSGDTNLPTFTLQTRNPLASKDSPISIASFAVYTKVNGKWDYANALWEIKAHSDTSLAVKTITYGVTPKGFNASVAAKPLVQGREYQGVGFGGNSNGSTSFKP